MRDDFERHGAFEAAQVWALGDLGRDLSWRRGFLGFGVGRVVLGLAMSDPGSNRVAESPKY
jgi:hypothetical protein